MKTGITAEERSWRAAEQKLSHEASRQSHEDTVILELCLQCTDTLLHCAVTQRMSVYYSVYLNCECTASRFRFKSVYIPTQGLSNLCG